MKKINSLLAIVLAACSLASCSLSDLFGSKENENNGGKKSGTDYDIVVDVKGGTTEEQTALLQALNASIVTKNSKDAIYPDSKVTLKEDDGDFIRLIHTYTKKGFTTNFDWEVVANDYCTEFVNFDASAYRLDPLYKGWAGKADSGSVSFKIKNIACGDAKAENVNITYTASVVNQQYYHKDVTIAEINAASENKYNLVDYTAKSPYFVTLEQNEGMDKNYYYVNVKGKIIYYAPDGNWALLADGDQVLELYTGAGTPLTPEKWPNMANKYVVVSGNLSQYCGNIQLGFITKINVLADRTSITEPTVNYKDLDFSKFEVAEGAQIQAIDGFSNSLAKVTGKVVAGSLKDRDGAAAVASSLANNRFTFTLRTSDGHDITVAYDYHTDRDGNVGLFNALKAAVESTNDITIKGTMRYSGNDSTPFAQTAGGWNIIPFLLNHVA